MSVLGTANKDQVVGLLKRIMEYELAGVVRYTHYSLMVYGYNRIPITSWLRAQAQESLQHAERAGELITLLGEHPSLGIGPLLETHQHNINDLLQETLAHESQTKAIYYELLAATEGKSVLLEEYAREMIVQEEMHADEVDKMLRRPGDVSSFAS